jgi:molybdenum cofactor guanylyltransferase
MGRDKALLHLGGRRLLDRVRDALTPVVERVRVMGAPAPRRAGSDISAEGPEFRDFEAQPDLHPGLGPLSGIHAALKTTEFQAVLVVACDLPFVTTAFLRGLADRLGPADQAVVPVTPSGPVPVCAVYRVTALAALEARIARGELSARDFAASLDARIVEGEELSALDPERLCLLNVNTPEDYDAARSREPF